ncbi:hypothetical protein [Agromyces sp. Root1464]|uniref:hypothetical protein n=1 Tax=Agromyces sp. Root1464 TaxID=1736467 RepID=UPI001F238506|nr:hypothetical protein [Agromyces sp. Root1464]
MPRLDGRLHESARARLIDADRLGELAHRGRALGALERIEQAEARSVRERVTAGTATRASPATSPAPSVGASAPAAVAPPVVGLGPLAALVVGVPRMLPRMVPVVPVPVRVVVRVPAPVPVVALLPEVLGPALEPPAFLIAAHRDEGLFDQGDRVVRGCARGIRP